MKKAKNTTGFGSRILDFMSVVTVFLLFIGMIF